MNNTELLKYAIDNGMIDLSYVQEKVKMKNRQELLNKHPYKIWYGKDGNFHTYIPTETGRTPRKRKSKQSLEDVIVDYWKQQEENPTIQEVFSEWNDRRLSLEKISQSSHSRYIQMFDRFYSELGKSRIKAIQPEEITDFLEEQIPKHQLSAKAFSNLKTITKGIFKRAKKRKLIDFRIEDIFDELDLSETDFHKTIKDDREEVFDEKEMPLMLEYLEDNIDEKNLCLLLMFVTGMRIGEAVALKHEDFNGISVRVQRTETRYNDGSGNTHFEVKDFPKTEAGIRNIAIPKDYRWISKMVQHINPFGEFIFTNRDGDRIKSYSVRRRLSRLCKKLNIVPKSPHKIRKTYGTILMDNHIDNRMVIGLLGHTDIGTSEEHYHRNRRSELERADIISNIPDFKVD